MRSLRARKRERQESASKSERERVRDSALFEGRKTARKVDPKQRQSREASTGGSRALAAQRRTQLHLLRETGVTKYATVPALESSPTAQAVLWAAKSDVDALVLLPLAATPSTHYEVPQGLQRGSEHPQHDCNHHRHHALAPCLVQPTSSLGSYV